MTRDRIQRSILEPDSVGALASAEFGLEHPSNCYLLRSSRSDSYVVESAGGRNLVRIAPATTTSKELLDSLHVAERLRESGSTVVAPLRTVSGKLLVPLIAPEGLRYLMLFPWLSASPCAWTPQQVRAAGRSIAELHNHGRDVRESLRQNQSHLERLIAPRMEQRLVPIETDDARRFAEQVQLWRAGFVCRPATELAVGFRHGDAHRGNCVVVGDRLWWHDLEDCGTGWLSYDLAVFVWDLVHERGPHLEDARASLWQLIDGYREQRHLSELDAWAVAALIGLRELWLLAYHASYADEWGIGWLDNEYFARATAVMNLSLCLMAGVDHSEGQTGLDRIECPCPAS